MKITNRKDGRLHMGQGVWLLLVAAIFQIGFCDHNAAADAVSITLLEAVEIDGPSIHLGQIARIEGHE